MLCGRDKEAPPTGTAMAMQTGAWCPGAERLSQAHLIALRERIIGSGRRGRTARDHGRLGRAEPLANPARARKEAIMFRRVWALFASAVLLAALVSASIAVPASAGNPTACDNATAGWDHFYDAPGPPFIKMGFPPFPVSVLCD